MTLRDLGRLSLREFASSPVGGHAHFWDRALSRRKLFGVAAGAAAAAAAGSVLKPIAAVAGNAEPRPIPGGIMAAGQGWHVYGPGDNPPPATGLAEQSTIYDFIGDIACAIVRGTGTGRQGGAVLPLVFDTDMRFMKGRYVGMDRRMHTGTFGFI